MGNDEPTKVEKPGYYEEIAHLLRSMRGTTIVRSQSQSVDSEWHFSGHIGDLPPWLRSENFRVTQHAADAIERLSSELEQYRKLALTPPSDAANRPPDCIGNGIQRVYMVRASDFSMGRMMPTRIATASTLAAMVERCASDCHGKDAKSVGHGSCDLSVIVTIGDLEVDFGK